MAEIINTFRLFFNSMLPVFILLGILGFIVALIKVATQVQDRSLGFVFKFSSVFILVYFLKDSWMKQIVNFTKDMWGSLKYYGS